MSSRAAITVHRPMAEVQEQWDTPDALRKANADVTFREAPGDRGTEIHVTFDTAPPVVGRLTGGLSLTKAKEQLRFFKHRVETGEIPRSEAAPSQALAGRFVKQRPAQPLEQTERKAGVA